MKTLKIILISGHEITIGVLGDVDVSFNSNNNHNKVKQVVEIDNPSMAVIPIDLLVKVSGE